MAEGAGAPTGKGFWWTALAAFVGVIGGQAVVGAARAAYDSFRAKKA